MHLKLNAFSIHYPMKFIKLVILICGFTLSIQQLKAQNGIVFKIKYLPNRKYVSSSKVNSNMSMNIEGNKALLDKIAASGTKLPIEIVGENFTKITTTTGDYNKDKILPFVSSYTDNWSKQTVAGKVVKADEGPLYGQVIYGHVNAENKMSVDSIPSNKLSDTLKKIISGTISRITQQVAFPDKPLKVGESFIQELPLNIPLSGVNMSMTIKITYVFKSLENEIAHFDVTQAINYDFSQNSKGMSLIGKASGTGPGMLDYYVKENMIKQLTADLTLNFDMKINEMTMKGLARINSSTSYLITKN